MKKLFRLMAPYKWYVLAGVIALTITDGLSLLIPNIIRHAVDSIARGTATGRLLFIYGLEILGISLVMGILRFLWRYFIIGSSRKAEMDLRRNLFVHLLKLPISFFRERKTGDLMAHATNDVDAVRMAVGIGLVGLFDGSVMMVMTLVAMLLISVRLTLYAVIPMPFLAVIVLGFGRSIHSRFRRVQDSFSTLTERVREAVSGIRIIKAFVQEEGEEKHFDKYNRDYVQKNIDFLKVYSLFHPTIALFASLALAILLLLGGKDVIYGEISLGDFVAFSVYIGMLVWPMIAIGWVTNLFQRAMASYDRIEGILSVEPIREPRDGIEKPIEGQISIRKLTFGYGAHKPVLKDIEFELEPGMRLGITGRTGSGKSTLVKVIARLYDPPAGTVFIDGIDILRYRFKVLRDAIGVVPQDSFLFSATIRENIAFAVPDAPMERIEWAAKVAGIYDEIVEFPDGFDTVVGERGVTLSGGQKQRIALARTLLLDPRILILDDALSAVDAQKEAEILERLRDVMKGRTSIVISHRVVAIEDSDLILVLDGGRITEHGTHDELMKLNGYYAKLYRMQKSVEGLK